MRCPNCGVDIPDDSKFCQYCGNTITKDANNGLNKWKITCLTLMAISLISIGLAVFWGFKFVQQNEKIHEQLSEEDINNVDELISKYASLTKEYKTLDSKYAALDNTNKRLQSNYNEVKSDAEYWESRYDDVSDIANFMKRYAVIVGKDEYYYHKYGCRHCDDSAFWIFNTDYAISCGYKACPYCR